ncbi:MAG: archease [Deltaproteobacteria bacterium]|nr:archease [Deltaproteobacteria bacterium]
MSSGHRQLDHTADICLELWADNEVELLLEGARAIVEILMAGSDLPAEGSKARDVRLDAIDPDDRLVQWLNEIIVLATTEGFVFRSASLVLSGEGVLEGTILGISGEVVAELKSATYHELSLSIGPEEARARVVIDV